MSRPLCCHSALVLCHVGFNSQSLGSEPHPPIYRAARADDFPNFALGENGHRTGAPLANPVLNGTYEACSGSTAQLKIQKKHRKKEIKSKKKRKKERAYGTPDSHVVPHRSTDEACSGLTAQFGRDTVRFTEYGRRRPHRCVRCY